MDRGQLLSRREFRRAVLEKLGGECAVVTCSRRAVDAHHILNRRLWTALGEEGGYFLGNGAPVCSECHLLAEQTLVTCEELYEGCGVVRLLPSGGEWWASAVYDTWGNRVVSESVRVRGVLFDDEGCQRALRSGGVRWRVNWI